MTDKQLATIGGSFGSAVNAIVPQSISDVATLAKMIAGAGWAPKSYRKDPRNESSGFDQDKIALGIMHGMEVGMKPVQALQSIAVINGMPSIFGDGALGLVRSSGLLEDFQETPITGDYTGPDANGRTITLKDRVIAYHVLAKRKGQETPIEYTFTIDMAIKAKLWGKAGPWTDHPQRMLQMRARSWVLRDGFTEVLKGLSIAEEVQDIAIVSSETIPARPKTAKAALDAFAASPAPSAPATPETAVEPSETAAGGDVVDPETGEVIEEGQTAEFTAALPPIPKAVEDYFGAGVHKPFVDWFTAVLGETEPGDLDVQAFADAHADKLRAVAATSEKNRGVVEKIAAHFGLAVSLDEGAQ